MVASPRALHARNVRFTRVLGQTADQAAGRLEPLPRRGDTRATFLCLSEVDIEILLALAWVAPVTTEQVHRLVLEIVSISQLRRRLVRLADAGMIAGAMYYTQAASGKPVRLGRIWSLTRPGMQAMENDDRMPTQSARVREALVRHDLLLSEFLSHLLLYAQPLLSGVILRREQRIDPTQPKPKCDAKVELRTGLETLVTMPWCAAPAAPGEYRKGWAIEADCGTETRSVIRAKGVAYSRVFNDPSFYKDGNRMPIPVWLVPDQARANIIVKEWYEVWPDGQWYILTAEHLPELLATVYRDGTQRLQHILADWK